MSAVLLAACGRAPAPAPEAAAETPVDVPPASVLPGEPIPVDPPPSVPTDTTVRRGIPLPDARAAGLWGRPAFTGCTSIHGVPSPPWFDDHLLAAAGWPSSQWEAVCRVVGCESNFDPERVGGLGRRMVGLLQLDSWSWGVLAREHGYEPGALRTALANLRVGRALFERLAAAHGSGEAWLPSSLGGWSCASVAA